MRYDKVMTLRTVTYTKDDIGQEVASYTDRDVYGNRFSVGAAEFYAAGREGMKADAEYQLRTADYADEQIVIIDGIDYQVIRVLEDAEFTRLVLQQKTGSGTNVS